ncbi:MAG TPA: DEAD/DEAH box helicase [Acidimicrobiia bacterium]|nr:DEAD/DEAH box helicase [Acidimicrobiia bacterium]
MRDAAQNRTDETKMTAEAFFAALPFAPDRFQVEAAESIDSGRSVVVTAPTGAGKTLVAEVAVHLALDRGRRAFYTTPIKALSNQKFGDFVERYGPHRVGLLTGDNVINGDAEVVVMTTEVLRNMIYADSEALDGVAVAVLDEVHYLQDPFRGAVWEEVIVHAPRHLQLVSLSATIANAVEFSEWVASRRGPTDLVVATERPVPLESEYMIKDRHSHEITLLPTFVSRDGRRRANPRIQRMLSLDRGRGRRYTGPRRPEVIEALWEEGMLPALYFIFSRAGCDAAALSIVESGIRLTETDEREEIRRIAEERTAHLSDADLGVLGYDRWIAGLEVGVAAHHAGMVPAFKETVEELFAAGRLGAVFATETLALGINMPARTVVLESLSKFNGETHELMQPGDYTQLTGRAGRRGIDDIGYGVVLHSRYVPFEEVTDIAAAGSHPLLSSFRPTYNMAANLVANYDEERAVELLEASFAQFQRQGDTAQAERRLAEMESRLDDERQNAECELGSVAEYAALLDEGSGRKKEEGLAGRLRPGDVIDVPSGSKAGRYAVLKPLGRTDGRPRLLVLGTSGRVSTIGDRDVVTGSSRAGSIDLPTPFHPRDRRFRQDALRSLRKVPNEPRSRRAAHRTPAHPVAECPDAEEHLRWLRRARRTERRVEQLRESLRSQGVGLVNEFDSIRRLLGDWGYLEGWSLTPRGRRLRFIYNELDLLLTEASERGLFWGLDARELAAFASTFVYEPRREEGGTPAWPTALLAERWEDLEALWLELTDAERSLHLPLSRRPEGGIARAVHEWAAGTEFEDLSDRSMAPGDFVRVSRQLVDLIRQIRNAVPEIDDVAVDALKAIDRGVVAAQGVG